jgi:gluconolactonase
LIVDDTIGDTVVAFDLRPDWRPKLRRAFAQLHDIPAGQESVAYGIALDRDDRVYVATVTGVQVFDRGGQYLGTIRVPRQPTNVAFSGADRRTLYITTREDLYRVRTLVQGPKRIGK